MASPQELEQEVALIISAGQSLMLNKYFILSTIVLWVYEYFLTLPDEIEYTWFGKSPWMFVVFVLNRYWPLWYLLWVLAADWTSGFTKLVSTSLCDKTSWFHVFYFAFTTLFAQVAITLRVYAVTGNNRWNAAYLSSVTLVQFVFVMYLAIRFALHPAFVIPNLPLEEFRFCSFHRWRAGEVAYTVLSLVYDTSAFLLIALSVKRRGSDRAPGVPSLIDKILQDATMYFLVIFSTHLLLILFEFFAPKPSQLLPAGLNAFLMPIMIIRLMLSLKKAANSPHGTVSDTTQMGTLRFAHRTIGGSERAGGSIALKPLSSEIRTGQTEEP